jgi:hypothetical protein
MKKLKSFALMTLFVSTSLLTSCSSDSGSDNENSGTSEGDYWPAAVGNQWVLNQGGTETTMKIISTEKIGESTYYKFDKFFAAPTSGVDIGGTATASLKKTGGDYLIKLSDININANGLSGKISGYEFIFFKDNLDVNKTWTGSYNQETTYGGIAAIKTTTKYTGTITEKGETATVKSVTYKDVIKFKFKLETSMQGQSAGTTEAEYWLAKGVGIIKFSYTGVSSELTSYKLN